MCNENSWEQLEKDQSERDLIEAAMQHGHQLAADTEQDAKDKVCLNCNGSRLKVFLGPGNIPFYKDCPSCT